MKEYHEFNLSNFINESLDINCATHPSMTPMYYPKEKTVSLFEEAPLKVLGELSFNSPKKVTEIETPVQEFFRCVNVFITGGSGFFGKILTEKLVRAMPHIGHVYLLLRPKRGKSSNERFEQLMKDKVFSRMKAEVPDYHTKITALAGDITEPDLGLSAEDRQLLLDKVHVVFHCAADVRFLEPLRKAIASNVLGSKHVLDLAKEMIHIKAFVYVSTAYSQCVHRVIEEKIPIMPVDYKDILQYVDSNTDSTIETDIKRIMLGWPNTYTFSKALCEDMLQKEAQGLPVCIFRPSMVMTSYKEPVRGWTDNTYGPAGAILGVALGILHCVKLNLDSTTDIVPVDYVVNCMIAAAWRTGTQRGDDMLPVYNFTATPLNTLHWKYFFEGMICLTVWPSNRAIWFPSLMLTDNYYLAKIGHFFLHKIPGAIIDKLVVMYGKRPRLVKTYKAIETLDEVTSYFKDGHWEFRNDNVERLWRSLSQEDKDLLNFDIRDVDWSEYVYVGWLGARHYFLKEQMETIPAAHNKLKWLRVLHIGVKVVFGLVLLKLVVHAAHLAPI